MPVAETLFDDLGGAAVMRRLVDRFYDLMDERPEATTIRALHPADLSESREKLYMFLTGYLGGPPLYVEKHGHTEGDATAYPSGVAGF